MKIERKDLDPVIIFIIGELKPVGVMPVVFVGSWDAWLLSCTKAKFAAFAIRYKARFEDSVGRLDGEVGTLVAVKTLAVGSYKWIKTFKAYKILVEPAFSRRESKI